jgi:hypothetical protein
LTGNAARQPGKRRFPGPFIVFALLIALLGVYVALYASLRKIHLIDNMFLSFQYPGNARSVYRLIEFYRRGRPENLARQAVDARMPLSEIADGATLNLDAASRSVTPTDAWVLPFLFYPLERIEIAFRLETPAASSP